MRCVMISGRRAGGRASKIDKLLRKQTRSSHLEIEAKSGTQRYLRSDRLSDDAQTLRATDDCVMGYVLTTMIPFDPDYLIPNMEDPWQPDGQSLAGVSVAASQRASLLDGAKTPKAFPKVWETISLQIEIRTRFLDCCSTTQSWRIDVGQAHRLRLDPSNRLHMPHLPATPALQTIRQPDSASVDRRVPDSSVVRTWVLKLLCSSLWNRSSLWLELYLDVRGRTALVRWNKPPRSSITAVSYTHLTLPTIYSV